MILEEETFEKFGYYPRDLKPKSNKRILVTCDKCNRIREIKKEDYRNLCKFCVNKGKHRSKETKKKMREAAMGKKNHMYGKSHTEETKQKMRDNHADFKGKKSGTWKGGLSFEPYCILFNDEFKERVREYWNRRCVVCGKIEAEQMNEMLENEKRPFRLAVHHVNYNKETCCDDSTPLFVSLCASCHAKIKFDDEYWEKYFTALIYNKNNDGKCFYAKEEYKDIKE